uniref:Myb/SANT-like domain-containing protein n=1 Tax=Oryza meridionalis TaxID=40149 RepID=A0A0E0CH15_9ORYZ
MADLDEVGGGVAGQGARGVLRWTAHMSAFMLRKMVELIAQVYNHLRKWRSRWVCIARLKDLSGALWDDHNNMIVLEEEHYMGHTKDKPKDVEFLNVPLENYTPMSIIFGGTQATGRFAMGSNEALGAPADMADSGLGVMDGDMEGGNGVGAGCASAAGASGAGPVGGNFIPAVNDIAGGSSSSGKRKRTPVVTEEEGAFLTNMTGAMHEVAAAIRSTAHTEVHPELYNAVMDLPSFNEDQLDLVLTHLTADKSTSLIYIQKNEARRACWVTKFLAQHHPDCI